MSRLYFSIDSDISHASLQLLLVKFTYLADIIHICCGVQIAFSSLIMTKSRAPARLRIFGRRPHFSLSAGVQSLGNVNMRHYVHTWEDAMFKHIQQAICHLLETERDMRELASLVITGYW